MKFFKIIIGVVIGIVVWFFVHLIVGTIISLIAQVPILGAILYYPSDASWALITLPPLSAVFAGAACSAKISNTTRPFSILIITLYALYVFTSFSSGVLSWTIIGSATVAIVSAVVCFPIQAKDVH